MREKTITVELPAPPSGGYGSPSGDTEFEKRCEEHRKECNSRILLAVPAGYSLQGVEKKIETIVRHAAVLKLVKD